MRGACRLPRASRLPGGNVRGSQTLQSKAGGLLPPPVAPGAGGLEAAPSKQNLSPAPDPPRPPGLPQRLRESRPLGRRPAVLGTTRQVHRGT